jgi:hypothetical protein
MIATKKWVRAFRACGYRLRREVSRYKNVVLKGCRNCRAWARGVKRNTRNPAKLVNTPIATSRCAGTSVPHQRTGLRQGAA